MNNFETEMTNGQLKTVNLLKIIIDQKTEKNRIVGNINPKNQPNLIIPEKTLQIFANIGNKNENLVFEILRKYIDLEGKITEIE